MADLFLATDRVEDLLDLVRRLESDGHHVAVRPVGQAQDPGPARAAIVDTVKDFFGARDLARTLRSRDDGLALVAIVAPEHLDGIGPDWPIDSFLVDPPDAIEALARLRLLIAGRTIEETALIRVGDLVIDPESYQVKLRGRPLDLTYKEFQLLSFLAQRPGRVWTRQQLLQELWGYDFFGGTRTVDVHIRRLRAKLGAEHESMIGTIRNVGYKLEARR